VHLRIGVDGQEIVDAGDLWGSGTDSTLHVLSSGSGPAERGVLAIGPAGERCVRFASIAASGGHAAGRTGMGAVMGAKQLKAIVVEADARGGDAGPETKSAVHAYLRSIRGAQGYDAWRRLGGGAVAACSDAGMLATRNFRQSTYEHAARSDAVALERLLAGRRGCRRCPVQCKAEMVLESSRYAGDRVARPEFESLCVWSARVGIVQGEDAVHLSALCDDLGLDTISTAATVAFAIDLFERGIIDRAFTGGWSLSWGDVAAIEALVTGIAARRGPGDVLAEGVRRAARRLGEGAKDCAYHVKGLEMPAYEPRGSKGTQLALAVANRGADVAAVYLRHETDCTPAQAARLYGDPEARDRLSPVGKAAMVRRGVVVGSALDAIGLCKVPALSLINDYELESEADLVTAVTGIDCDPGRLFTVGERIVTMGRLIDVGLGASSADDTLPRYFAETPLVDGPGAGQTAHVDEMVAEYYESMGWSPDGMPAARTIEGLGLAEWWERSHLSGTTGGLS
jgi:aldehyde:ferredoxin oxidoreductase